MSNGALVNAREAAKTYLASHQIPQMLESLLSCLMIERPEDPVTYIEKKMIEIRRVGIENVNWETFVFALHPYRDPVRMQNIRDGSKFDKEREVKEGKGNDNVMEKERSEYEPDVFELTEAH